ncbi:hypothetical protein [Zavarzinia sp.]|uniref:hypothetical protein n=1 Tax=Zavarzinia sp. TaxID=2027920 RepID=UPI003564083C
MAAVYRVAPLKAGEIEAAFPLAYACLGTPDLETWRETVRRFADHDESGLVAAERDGYIRGLLAYSVLPSVSGRQVLVVQSLGVLELLFPERAALALVDAVKAIARTSNCDEIVFAVAQDSGWLSTLLSDHAWQDAGRLMVGHQPVMVDNRYHGHRRGA